LARNASASALNDVKRFFYGPFMDEELLRGKGFEPKGGEIAAIDGLAFRIGQRAALVPRGRSAAQTHQCDCRR